MRLSRRSALQIGGCILAGLTFGSAGQAIPQVIDVTMNGNKDGSVVWFAPLGLLVRPGQMVRWTNKDPGNVHTTTAYHPANEGHPLRIPADADAWNSGYLLPDQSFSVLLTKSGVYDYYCVPHEQAGMVGRIVVTEGLQSVFPPVSGGVPDVAEKVFPSVEDILRQGQVFKT